MSGGVADSLRRPEYTGENRCLPCTVVNAGITLAVSGGIAGAGAWAGTPLVGGVAGVAFFLISLAAIYLRGYLVPGTPTLTKRYFPDWLLAAFGKDPSPESTSGVGGEGVAVDPEEEIDPEAVLVGVGALEECAEGDDLCLTDDFRSEWYRAIDEAEGANREQLLELLDVEGDVVTEEFGDAFRVTADDQPVGKWESRAAFIADLGAANVLSTHLEDWDALPVHARSQLLNGLRLFIDTCPACGGVPEFGTDTVESCCSTHEVAAVSCTDCGARLFESRPV